MIQNIISSTILIFLAILLILSQSCDFDQITSEYSDFKTANQNGFFEKGWIPSDLVFNSMTNIYQRTNLDLNFCVFNYNLSKIDLEKLKLKVKPSSVKLEIPHRVTISQEWIKIVNELNHYMFVQSDEIDTVYIAIDDKNSIIYGWRE